MTQTTRTRESDPDGTDRLDAVEPLDDRDETGDPEGSGGPGGPGGAGLGMGFDVSQVLWGRVAVLAVGALVAFLLGRWTADGVAPDEFEDLQQRLDAATEEVDDLRGQLAEARRLADDPPAVADGTSGPEAGSAGAGRGDAGNDGTADGAGATGSVVPGDVYVVEAGDSLAAIAQRAYGDMTRYPLIVEANDLGDDPVLQIGQELVVPPLGAASGDGAEDAGAAASNRSGEAGAGTDAGTDAGTGTGAAGADG